MAVEAFSYRCDPAVPPFQDDRPIFIFDGHCVLCSGFARFILSHDDRHLFRLMAAQSPLGTALYKHYGLHAVDYQTNLLIEDGRAWFKSESSIRVFERLGFPWSLATAARIVRMSLLDRLYGIVARNRFRWFGRRSTCYLPDPSESDRFIQ